MVTPTDEYGRKKFEQDLRRQRELEEFLKALKPDEVSFFVRFGNELNKRRPQVRTFDDHLLSDPRSNQPWKTPEKDYVEHLGYFVNLQVILKLRNQYSRSPNKRLPKLEFFADKIIIEPLDDGPPSMWGYRTDGPNAPALRTAICKAIREALEQTLGLRTSHSIAKLRKTTVVNARLAGKTHKEIVKELDANPDLANDPLLKKWAEEFLLRVGTWAEALAHPDLGKRVKSYISTTCTRANNQRGSTR